MNFAYQRKRSETGVRCPEPIDKAYHDFHRGWATRGVQIRLNLEFKQRFYISPDFGGEGAFPFAKKEAGGSYNGYFNTFLEDEWEHWSSAEDETNQWHMRLETNMARGMRVSCTFNDAIPEAILVMKGCRRESDTGVEFNFPFCFHFKKPHYEKTELEAFDRIRGILNAIDSPPCKRARR
jgi:hypothetical protein